MFYDNLKKICDEKNISVPKVMEAIGSTRGIAFNWKKRGTTPSANTVSKLAKVLNCSVVDLLEGNAPNCEIENAPTETDERTEKFVELFNRLTDEQKDIVLAQLEGIVAKL